MANFTVSLLLKAVDEATAPLRRVTGALGGLRGGAKEAAGHFAMFGLAADGAAKAWSLITAPLRLLNDAIVEPTAKYETFLTQLETTEHSAEKAKAALAWIKQFAKDTPYNVDEVTRAFIRLRSQGVEGTDGTLRILGDASGAFGKSLVDGVEALTDALTGENERLKEFGVTASTDAKAKTVTYSWMEAGKQVERTVSLTDRKLKQSVLLGAFDANFRGGMERLSKTWKGQLSNLEDTWESFKVAIGDAGFLDFLKERLKAAQKTLDEMTQSGELKQLSEELGHDLTEAARAFVGLLPDLREAFRFIGEVIAIVRREVKLAISDWDQVVDALTRLWARMVPILNAMRSVENVVRGVVGAAPLAPYAMPELPSPEGGGGGPRRGGARGAFGGNGGADDLAGGIGRDRLLPARPVIPSIFGSAGQSSPAAGRIVVEFRNPPPDMRVKRIEADGIDLIADLGWVMQ